MKCNTILINVLFFKKKIPNLGFELGTKWRGCTKQLVTLSMCYPIPWTNMIRIELMKWSFCYVHNKMTRPHPLPTPFHTATTLSPWEICSEQWGEKPTHGVTDLRWEMIETQLNKVNRNVLHQMRQRTHFSNDFEH